MFSACSFSEPTLLRSKLESLHSSAILMNFYQKRPCGKYQNQSSREEEGNKMHLHNFCNRTVLKELFKVTHIITSFARQSYSTYLVGSIRSIRVKQKGLNCCFCSTELIYLYISILRAS